MTPAQALNTVSIRGARIDAVTICLAVFLPSIVVCQLAAAFPDFQHWFIGPVLLCGIMTAFDSIDWIRGRLNVFDPVGLLGVFCFYSLFVAPLLHVYWDMWIGEVPWPPDWRPWLGYMALLNAAGYGGYVLARRLVMDTVRVRQRPAWRAHPQALVVVTAAVLVGCGLVQAWVYGTNGGIFGVVAAYQERSESLDGLGIIFMFAESFPIVFALAALVFLAKRPKRPTWMTLTLFLTVIFVLAMLFGGLRGSRNNTVATMVWVVGAIHFYLRPVPRHIIYCGVLGMLSFMYLYGLYKGGGSFDEIFAGSGQRRLIAYDSGRSIEGVLLGDLGRADVQAFALYRLTSDPKAYNYAWGRSYLGAASILIPRSIIPNRPPHKVKWGTELQRGAGEYDPDGYVSSRVYGLAGEAMLNFTPIAVPFAYALFGVCIGFLRSWIASLQPGDLRLLLAPFGCYLCIWAFGMDSDNVLFRIFKGGFVPMLVILAWAKWRWLFERKRSWQTTAYYVR